MDGEDAAEFEEFLYDDVDKGAPGNRYWRVRVKRNGKPTATFNALLADSARVAPATHVELVDVLAGGTTNNGRPIRWVELEARVVRRVLHTMHPVL